jgi:cysteine desulfuration protein SufE
MNPTIQAVQEEIVEEFSLFENKDDIYNYIIELGKNLPTFPEEHRKDDNLIKGCQSKVWIFPTMQAGLMHVHGDSDSTLVKGLVSLVLRVYSDRQPNEIVNNDLFFIDRIGLKSLLSMNRANGLASLVKQIKLYALALQAQGK